LHRWKSFGLYPNSYKPKFNFWVSCDFHTKFYWWPWISTNHILNMHFHGAVDYFPAIFGGTYNHWWLEGKCLLSLRYVTPFVLCFWCPLITFHMLVDFTHYTNKCNEIVVHYVHEKCKDIKRVSWLIMPRSSLLVSAVWLMFVKL
jgi:hypothetical protein